MPLLLGLHLQCNKEALLSTVIIEIIVHSVFLCCDCDMHIIYVPLLCCVYVYMQVVVMHKPVGSVEAGVSGKGSAHSTESS